MKSILIAFLCSFLLIFISCEKTTITERIPAIYGVAVDENGNPIADAEVCVIPDLIYLDEKSEQENSILLNYPNPVYSGTLIQFDLKENTDATLIIKSQSTGLTIVQSASFKYPGKYAYQFDNNIEGSNFKFPPGVYTAYLNIKDTVYAKRDFVIDFKFDTLECSIPKAITKTDSKGNFVIPYNWFPDAAIYVRYLDDGIRLDKFQYGGTGKIIVRKRIENSEPSVDTEYKVSTYNILEIDKSKVVDIVCKTKNHWIPI